jgi:hypothetical protein
MPKQRTAGDRGFVEMHSNINIDVILKEISELKRQMQAAQVRLAALEELLKAAQEQKEQQTAQVEKVEQVEKPVKKAEKEVDVKTRPKRTKKDDVFEFEGDPSLALQIMELIASHGDLRVSLIKWYLSSKYDTRVTERDIISTAKSLERHEALRCTWAIPGAFGTRIPVSDPWANKGPEFYSVRRRLEDLLSKRVSKRR